VFRPKFETPSEPPTPIRSSGQTSPREYYPQFAAPNFDTVPVEQGWLGWKLALHLQSLTPNVPLAKLLERFRSAYPEVEFAVRSLQFRRFLCSCAQLTSTSIKKLRDPFFIHAGDAAHEDLLLPACFVLSSQA
jgi:hypothetical protein